MTFKSCIFRPANQRFKTPQQSSNSTKVKTPVSENTQAKSDFDSFDTTPLKVEEITVHLTCKTPAANTDEDFDSLGNTPANDK